VRPLADALPARDGGAAVPRWRLAGRAIGAMAVAPTTSRLAGLTFFVGLLANLVLAESLRAFPFEDATNNLTRYVMLDRAWLHGSGVLPSYIEAHFVVGPYLGVDLIGAVLVHLLGPSGALHAIAALVVCAIPVGAWMLLSATGRATSAWSLAGVLLGLGFFTVVGFFNYVIGLGAALLWLAAWWPTRAAPTPVRMVGLWLGLVILYLLHLSAPLIAMVVVWVDITMLLVSSGAADKEQPADPAQRHRAREWPRTLVRERRCRFALAATGLLMGTALWGGVGAAPPGENGQAIAFSPFTHKLMNLFSPFYVFSSGQAAIAIVVYAAMGATFFWLNRGVLARMRFRSPLLGAAVAFLVLYLAFPAGTPGTGYLDMRWLPPMFLLPFAAAEAQTVSPPRFITMLMLGGCLLHAAVLGRSMRAIDHELADYREVLDRLPRGGRVLPLVADRNRHGLRIFPYRHFAFWYVIEHEGRVPALFNGAGEGAGRPRHAFLAHFIERDHLVDPGGRWGTAEFAPLDWPEVDRDYDYIIQCGADPRVAEEIGAHGYELLRVGDVALFAVQPGR
jgi:hypothetical protein